MRSGRSRVSLALAAVLVVIAGACGGSSSGADHVATSGQSGSITVAVATPLTDAFKQIAIEFRQANPDAKVALDFDAPAALAKDLIAGSATDVFAADETNMKKLIDAQVVEGLPPAFARNALVIVVQPGNPLGITTVAELDRASTVALCAEETPCGKATDHTLEQAGVTLPSGKISRTLNVTGTLKAVSEGRAEAGIGYASDAFAAGAKVEAVPIPGDIDTPTFYMISPLTKAVENDLANAFVAYVTGPKGQAVLKEHGFTSP